MAQHLFSNLLTAIVYILVFKIIQMFPRMLTQQIKLDDEIYGETISKYNNSLSCFPQCRWLVQMEGAPRPSAVA